MITVSWVAVDDLVNQTTVAETEKNDCDRVATIISVIVAHFAIEADDDVAADVAGSCVCFLKPVGNAFGTSGDGCMDCEMVDSDVVYCVVAVSMLVAGGSGNGDGHLKVWVLCKRERTQNDENGGVLT